MHEGADANQTYHDEEPAKGQVDVVAVQPFPARAHDGDDEAPERGQVEGGRVGAVFLVLEDHLGDVVELGFENRVAVQV